jgi:hypothetical protein
METDGGGWTVFQRRQHGSVNFQRNRIEYIRGFGNVSGEYWLGLAKIHRLTVYDDFRPELRVDVGDFDGNAKYEHYDEFYISGPSGYNIYIGHPSGTAGDSLAHHNTIPFSTPDHDVDKSTSRNCALQDEGAWWFNNCQHSHLNGKYYYGKVPFDKGIIWETWKTDYYSLKQAEMKIRPSRLIWKQKDN